MRLWSKIFLCGKGGSIVFHHGGIVTIRCRFGLRIGSIELSKLRCYNM